MYTPIQKGVCVCTMNDPPMFFPLPPPHDTQHGSSAKFSGSGGAIIGVCLDPAKKVNSTFKDAIKIFHSSIISVGIEWQSEHNCWN